MKKATIYFEGKPLMNVEYDNIDVEKNGHYLYLEKQEQAFVPFSHLIITKEVQGLKATINATDLSANWNYLKK